MLNLQNIVVLIYLSVKYTILQGARSLGLVELANRLEIATVTTGKLIDRLEERGFVERRPHPEDRRAKLVFATDLAKPAVKFLTRCIGEVDKIAFAGMSDEDVAFMRDRLDLVRENLLKACNRG